MSRKGAKGEDTCALVRLPEVLALGFTGHRELAAEASCGAQILNVLQREMSAGRVVYGVSSVAAGADLLFAEGCLRAGVPLRVLLPLPHESFRRDFQPEDWARVEAVLRAAVSVEVTGQDASGMETNRDERYYECGLETVQQSQMLLAVWDGQPARGLGGTAEIVAFAREMGRRVIWIHSETGSVQEMAGRSTGPAEADAELAFLNSLPDGAADAASMTMEEAWLAKLDANAMRVAPQVRRMAAVPIVLTALAAFASGSAPKMQPMGPWLAAGGALGVAAAVLPALLGLNRRQALWARIRTAAEVSRSVVALWQTPGRYGVVGPESLPELAAMLRSLELLKAQAGGAPAQLAVFRERYLETRVMHQKEYFRRQSASAAEKAGRYRLLSKVCAVAAIAITAWTFAEGTLLHHAGGVWWLPLVASALFQVATVAGALVVVHDCDRRQRRYLELHRSLSGWERELRAVHTWPPALQVVDRIERALFVELLEWRSLLQNRKMPRS
jgi:hypothetical protein